MDEQEVCRIVPTTRVMRYNVERFRRQFYHRMIGAAILTLCFVCVLVFAIVRFS